MKSHDEDENSRHLFLKTQIHQTDIKELVETKHLLPSITCVLAKMLHLNTPQRKTTATSILRMWRGNNSP